MRQRKNSCLHFLLQHNTSVSLTCRRFYGHIGLKKKNTNTNRPFFAYIYTQTYIDECKPRHHLAVSLHKPRANRWWMLCTALRWYLHGCCSLKSLPWMSISNYNSVAKVIMIRLITTVYLWFILKEWVQKNWLMYEEPSKTRKRPTEHPRSKRPKSHTHSFCHPSLSMPLFVFV